MRIAVTSAEAREQLSQQGYANVDFPLGKQACGELFDNFKSFVALCEEPGGEKLAHAVTFDVNGLGNGVFEFDHRQPGQRSDQKGQRAAGNDHKYIFHYGVQTSSRVQEALGTLPGEMNTFLENCDEFYHAGRKSAEVGIKALGIEPILLPQNPDHDVHLLRLIDYIAGDDKNLGKAHFDRGVTTLAISESSPGLRGMPADNNYLDRPEPLRPTDQELTAVDHHEHVAKFFTGAGLRRLPKIVRNLNDLDEVPLFAHDIINENPGENRQAVVMFFNPHLNFKDYTVPTKDETHI